MNAAMSFTSSRSSLVEIDLYQSIKDERSRYEEKLRLEKERRVVQLTDSDSLPHNYHNQVKLTKDNSIITAGVYISRCVYPTNDSERYFDTPLLIFSCKDISDVPSLQVWDLYTLEYLYTIPFHQTTTITLLMTKSDYNNVIMSDEKGRVYYWNPNSEEPTAVAYFEEQNYQITAIAVQSIPVDTRRDTSVSNDSVQETPELFIVIATKTGLILIFDDNFQQLLLKLNSFTETGLSFSPLMAVLRCSRVRNDEYKDIFFAERPVYQDLKIAIIPDNSQYIHCWRHTNKTESCVLDSHRKSITAVAGTFIYLDDYHSMSVLITGHSCGNVFYGIWIEMKLFAHSKSLVLPMLLGPLTRLLHYDLMRKN